MKLIKIIAKQNLVNYRKIMSYGLKETYPLPPYSTVIGMVHNACGFTSYHPMKVSVQGKTDNIVSDIYTKYSFKGGSPFYEKARHQICTLDSNKKQYGITRAVGNIELIADIDLVIHIMPEDENELEIIYEGLKNPENYLSLGRYEDLLDIEKIEIVNCEKKEFAFLTNQTYIPLISYNSNELEKGTIYKLFKTFSINKNNVRTFDKPIKVKYVNSESNVADVYVDDDGTPVFLA